MAGQNKHFQQKKERYKDRKQNNKRSFKEEQEIKTLEMVIAAGEGPSPATSSPETPRLHPHHAWHCSRS